jgi:dihydrofolate reductase
MRKLIVCNLITVDGCYTTHDGDVMGMPFDAGFDDYNAERLRAATTVLLGRISYEGFESYWPEVAGKPEVPEVEREVSRSMNAIDKVVVSDTLAADRSTPWASTTRIVPRAGAHAAVSELKRGDGGDILVFGSHILWNDLLARGLVDELHLTIGPGVLGDGIRAFDRESAGRLQLVDTRRFAGSSLLLTVYRPDPAS